MNTKFTLFYSNTCGIASNQFYPYEIQINSENDLKTAVSHGHVCARYQNGLSGLGFSCLYGKVKTHDILIY